MQDSSLTRVCSVLFVDVVGYSKQPVAEQLLLKQALRDLLNSALDQIDPRERRIQDTGDGAVVVFTGDPEDALFAAMSTRDSAGALRLRLGINLGPVYLSEVSDSQTDMVGDGINAAQRVMSFAEPGQLLVSRSFRDVAYWLSSEYDRLFVHEASRADKHGRMHELYSVTTSVRAGRRVASRSGGRRNADPGGDPGVTRAGPPRGLRRGWERRPVTPHRRKAARTACSMFWSSPEPVYRTLPEASSATMYDVLGASNARTAAPCASHSTGSG